MKEKQVTCNMDVERCAAECQSELHTSSCYEKKMSVMLGLH